MLFTEIPWSPWDGFVGGKIYVIWNKIQVILDKMSINVILNNINLISNDRYVTLNDWLTKPFLHTTKETPHY